MQISKEQIAHLATISSLTFTEAELADLQIDLDQAIDYISQIDNLDTTGFEPTYFTEGKQNVWRPDEITPQSLDRDQLLALAPDVEDHQIKVPRTL